MDFTVKSGSPEKHRTPCVVVGIYEGRRLTSAAEKIDDAAGGYLSDLLRRGDIEGKAGQSLLLYKVLVVLAESVLLIGCGRECELGNGKIRKIVAKATSLLNELGVGESLSCLIELAVFQRDTRWKTRQHVDAGEDALFCFEQLKSKKDAAGRPLRKCTLLGGERGDVAETEEAVRIAKAVAEGIKLTKDLGNLPPNICTPGYLADQARTLAKRHKTIKVEVLDRGDMEKLGMGALLAVARGSQVSLLLFVVLFCCGLFFVLSVVLDGLGVTFDSGGISIKPAQAMDEMKFDMCGAASVLGTLETIALLKLPLNVVGVIPSTENLPSGTATKPGDVVTSLSGQTIEILNTDAEGRLILCDALTYTERFEPDVVIDIATLTGACVVALGKHASGLLGNNEALIQALLKAGKETGDRAWELPQWEDYQDQLKTLFADMANVGGRDGGTITAACFLSRITKKFQWAHLDIAGTAWLTGDKKGATGRPVPLLTQYLLDRVAGRQAGADTKK